MKLNGKVNSDFSPHMPWRSRAFRRLLTLVRDLLFDVTIEGQEHIPTQNCMVVANHLSWIDHLLLMTVLPAEPRPYLVGASQSVSSPLKRWLLTTLGGVIPFERGANWVGRDTLEKPLLVLRCGASLVLFPEGDVSRTEGQILPLKRGIGHFALRADYPILPIALCGVKELYWRKSIRVIIGQPFRVRNAGQERHRAIDAAVRQVEEALRELLPPYQEAANVKKRLRFLTDLSDRL